MFEAITFEIVLHFEDGYDGSINNLKRIISNTLANATDANDVEIETISSEKYNDA
jgi:hypothetical protein